MKAIKTNKKLVLLKTTIANLENKAMNLANGGGEGTPIACISLNVDNAHIPSCLSCNRIACQLERFL